MPSQNQGKPEDLKPLVHSFSRFLASGWELNQWSCRRLGLALDNLESDLPCPHSVASNLGRKQNLRESLLGTNIGSTSGERVSMINGMQADVEWPLLVNIPMMGL